LSDDDIIMNFPRPITIDVDFIYPTFSDDYGKTTFMIKLPETGNDPNTTKAKDIAFKNPNYWEFSQDSTFGFLEGIWTPLKISLRDAVVSEVFEDMNLSKGAHHIVISPFDCPMHRLHEFAEKNPNIDVSCAFDKEKTGSKHHEYLDCILVDDDPIKILPDGFMIASKMRCTFSSKEDPYDHVDCVPI